ncbi:MAG: LysM peptidoglycan-binding domain-containing protein, partial [Verrucomicrobiales bacterium]|nr:LysM peptidoglycan-binding domain-containing protein [Verrucomicrobiales bacterium]
IARRYGITSAALMRANPRIRARNMPVGTILRIPER